MQLQLPRVVQVRSAILAAAVVTIPSGLILQACSVRFASWMQPPFLGTLRVGAFLLVGSNRPQSLLATARFPLQLLVQAKY